MNKNKLKNLLNNVNLHNLKYFLFLLFQDKNPKLTIKKINQLIKEQ